MQPHTRCSGTHPGGRVSNRTQTLPEAIRGRATVGCHEMISHPIPSHAWAIRAHIQGSLSHTLTHIHAAVAPLSVATRNRTISSPRNALGTHNICLHLCHERTPNQPCRSQIPYPAQQPTRKSVIHPHGTTSIGGSVPHVETTALSR